MLTIDTCNDCPSVRPLDFILPRHSFETVSEYPLMCRVARRFGEHSAAMFTTSSTPVFEELITQQCAPLTHAGDCTSPMALQPLGLEFLSLPLWKGDRGRVAQRLGAVLQWDRGSTAVRCCATVGPR